jgi:RimJ/RimL family protein N-acetyltransferase
MSVIIDTLPDGTVVIQTPRLLLRAAQPSDAEDLHLCFSDPEVMRYWYVGAYTS